MSVEMMPRVSERRLPGATRRNPHTLASGMCRFPSIGFQYVSSRFRFFAGHSARMLLHP